MRYTNGRIYFTFTYFTVLSPGQPGQDDIRKTAALHFHVTSRKYCTCSDSVLILLLSPLAGMPADNITGMAH